MAIGTTKHVCVGSRVEIPAYCDLWMQGARTGTIERVRVGKGNYLQSGDSRGATYFGVRMDHPQVKRLAWMNSDDCKYL